MKNLKKCIDTTELENKINQKLNSLPSIMVYGIYNSGKSTLINALLGKNLAKIGDIPTTDKIEKFEFNGYDIYDTPGIEAPIAHQKITKEHLKLVEVVLFVLSTDSSFEEKLVYQNIKSILEMKKNIILVLNDKGSDINSAIKKLEINLEKFNINPLDLKIVSINAKSALKAKLENKSLLLEKSNILLLEKTILDSVKEGNIDNTIEFLINEFISQNIQKLISQIDDESVKEKEDILNILESEKNRKIFELVSFIEEKSSIIRENIVSLLMQDKDINAYIDSQLKEIQEYIINELNSSIDVVYKKITLKTPENDENFIVDNGIKVLKDKNVTTPAIKQVLLKLREWKIPKIKGRWESTLGKWASKAGVILAAFSFAYEVYSGYKRQKAQEEAQINRALEIEKIANEISFDISNQLKNKVKEMINEMYEEIKAPIKSELNTIKNKNQNILQKIECLKNKGVKK